MPRSIRDVERAQVADHMDEHLGLLGEAIILHDQLTEAILDLAQERVTVRGAA